MAKDGKKQELYEILAAKRGKGKPLFSGTGPPAPAAGSKELPEKPALIVDDAVRDAYEERLAEAPLPGPPEPAAEEAAPKRRWPSRRRPDPKPEPEPEPEPKPPRRPRTPREVVFTLDTGMVFFMAVLALLGSAYFLGYKRGQEEKPAALAGEGVDFADSERLPLSRLGPAPRAAVRPGALDYTLVLRTEPVGGEAPERLEMELSEAVGKGRREAREDVPGFIFRTGGADPRHVLAVGLGRSAGDPELDKLLKIYYKMDGLTLSREPVPYRGCRVAPVKDLGEPVF